MLLLFILKEQKRGGLLISYFWAKSSGSQGLLPNCWDVASDGSGMRAGTDDTIQSQGYN